MQSEIHKELVLLEATQDYEVKLTAKAPGSFCPGLLSLNQMLVEIPNWAMLTDTIASPLISQDMRQCLQLSAPLIPHAPLPMVLLIALVVKLGFGPCTESSHEPLPTA
jgi:hypothetical protein